MQIGDPICLAYSDETSKSIASKLIDACFEEFQIVFQFNTVPHYVEILENCSLYALIILMTDKLAQSKHFSDIIKLATKTKTQIILLDIIELDNFPSYNTIYCFLDKQVQQSAFSSSIVAYFSKNDPRLCLCEIIDKLEDVEIELKTVKDMYFIYKGAFGHHVAIVTSLIFSSNRDEIGIPLCHNENQAFLNKSKQIFFFVTPESLTDNGCLKELFAVLNSGKPITAIQSVDFTMPNSISQELKELLSVLPTLTYSTVSIKEFTSLFHNYSIPTTREPHILYCKYEEKLQELVDVQRKYIDKYIREIEDAKECQEYIWSVGKKLNSSDCDKAFKREIKPKDIATDVVVYVKDMQKAKEFGLIDRLPKRNDTQVVISELPVAEEC